MARSCSSVVVLLGVLLSTGFPLAGARAMEVATGSFVGDGMLGRAITGVGFAPEVVIANSAGAGKTALMRSTTMAGTIELATTNSISPGFISSLDPDGFTVDDNAKLNETGVITHWIAFGDVDDGFAVGTYLGDGAISMSVDISDTSSSPDFQSDYLIVLPESGQFPIQRFEDGGDEQSSSLGFTGPLTVGSDVTALTPTGFSMTGGDRTNELGTRYHYVAWRERAGTEVGTYVGSTDLTVSLPFSPAFVSVTRESCCQRSRYRTDAHAADESSYYRALEETTDAIKDFTASGFEVGSSADTSSATTHFFVAFESTAPTAVPALPAVLLALLAVVLGGVGLTLHRESA
jgi:hypothetical protein